MSAGRVLDVAYDVTTTLLERLPVAVVSRRRQEQLLRSAFELGRDYEQQRTTPDPAPRRHLRVVPDAG